MKYIGVVKHTNCHGKSNNGKNITKYSGTIKVEDRTRTFHWINKQKAVELINNGLPLTVDSVYMVL